jgi:hypothetical protein
VSAVFAGLMAWFLEVFIALFILYIVKFEESKVFKRRKK